MNQFSESAVKDTVSNHGRFGANAFSRPEICFYRFSSGGKWQLYQKAQVVLSGPGPAPVDYTKEIAAIPGGSGQFNNVYRRWYIDKDGKKVYRDPDSPKDFYGFIDRVASLSGKVGKGGWWSYTSTLTRMKDPKKLKWKATLSFSRSTPDSVLLNRKIDKTLTVP